MKAAVLHQFGESPRYEDFPEPIPNDDEVIIEVKAVSLENIDRTLANGTHFASRQFLPSLPAVVGLDGIGTLPDGRLVGFGGVRPPFGAVAERTVVAKTHTVPVPDGIEAITAATVPSSALTALFPLKWGAALQPNETVLINGATGFAGKLAVQIAKLLGAARVIGTGRDDASLRSLSALGADGVIDLKQSDAEISAAFTAQAGENGYHVILDFLWGHPTELLIETLIPRTLSFARHRTRLIQVGQMAGSHLSLAAEALRTSGLEIVGAGGGLTPERMTEAAQEVWEWIRAGKLRADIDVIPLKDITSAWERITRLHGSRIVIVP